MRIAVLNGPNLNLLGQREPEIYGRTTLAEIEAHGPRGGRAAQGVEIEWFQTNHEGALVDAVQGLRGRVDGALINAAALTHTSLALRDALLAVQVPFVELHLSNIFAREPERRHSVIADLAIGIVTGFGAAELRPGAPGAGGPSPCRLTGGRERQAALRAALAAEGSTRCSSPIFPTSATSPASPDRPRCCWCDAEATVLVTDFRYAVQAPAEAAGAARVEIDQTSVWDRLGRVLGELATGRLGIEAHVADGARRGADRGRSPGAGWCRRATWWSDSGR